MRRFWLSFVGATLLTASPAAFTAPAHADPAYSSDAVVNIFAKEKAEKKLGHTRSICVVGADSSCGKPPAPTVFDLLVTFEFNSEKLTPAARDNLNQFAKALEDPRLKGTKFEVDGHTDATGTEEYNYGLSERRAKAVVEYLASLGVDPATLAAHGFGKTKPRVSDPFSPENRRVETKMIE
jgi:outer membrane protein OmpA-like peptidoglycan-associated protein